MDNNLNIFYTWRVKKWSKEIIDMIIMKVKHLPHPNFFFRKGLHKRQVFLKENINPNFTI